MVIIFSNHRNKIYEEDYFVTIIKRTFLIYSFSPKTIPFERSARGARNKDIIPRDVAFLLLDLSPCTLRVRCKKKMSSLGTRVQLAGNSFVIFPPRCVPFSKDASRIVRRRRSDSLLFPFCRHLASHHHAVIVRASRRLIVGRFISRGRHVA